MFQRIVARPIPKSVKEIRTDRHSRKAEHVYIVHFAISQDDFRKAVAADTFKPLACAEYFGGDLYYGLSHRVITSFTLYDSKDEEPDWFDLEDWKDVTAYIAEEKISRTRCRLRIMFYNEPLGRACVVERDMRELW